jgi:hypothetical protein
MRFAPALFSGTENGILEGMEPAEILKLAQAAEAKLASGLELSRREQLALLAFLLASQPTRKERKYGLA